MSWTLWIAVSLVLLLLVRRRVREIRRRQFVALMKRCYLPVISRMAFGDEFESPLLKYLKD